MDIRSSLDIIGLLPLDFFRLGCAGWSDSAFANRANFAVLRWSFAPEYETKSDCGENLESDLRKMLLS
jgi:hypothetical protein